MTQIDDAPEALPESQPKPIQEERVKRPRQHYIIDLTGEPEIKSDPRQLPDGFIARKRPRPQPQPRPQPSSVAWIPKRNKSGKRNAEKWPCLFDGCSFQGKNVESVKSHVRSETHTGKCKTCGASCSEIDGEDDSELFPHIAGCCKTSTDEEDFPLSIPQ